MVIKGSYQEVNIEGPQKKSQKTYENRYGAKIVTQLIAAYGVLRRFRLIIEVCIFF